MKFKNKIKFKIKKINKGNPERQKKKKKKESAYQTSKKISVVTTMFKVDNQPTV